MKQGNTSTRVLRLVSLVVGLSVLASPVHSAGPLPSSAILHDLECFRETGRVLYLAAHPDDENTRLIAYLARGRGYRTGYLSLTRGDGGQNLLGPELRDALGVIRTQELLAARQIDGGVQFFSRANDFGFSKTYTETFSFWDRAQVVADTVRVIRTFRPDVIITRFSLEPGGTHGHHTASAMVALEAFKAAADPAAFAAELGQLPPWQAKRLLWNAWPAARPAPGPDAPPVLHFDVGGYNPLLGESYGEIAARSRSMHKSQGFGAVGSRGSAQELFIPLAGEPATHDIFDGVDSTWARFAGGAALIPLIDDLIAQFRPQDPAASIPALLTLRSRVAALPADRLLNEKRRQLDEILVACLGLQVETTLASAEVVPGETLQLKSTAIVRNNFPVRWTAVLFPTTRAGFAPAAELQSNQPRSTEGTVVLPAGTALSQPYWLRAPGTAGMFRVDDPGLIGQPENPPALPIEHVFEIGGQTLVVPDQPVQVIGDPVKGEIRRSLEVVPAVALDFAQDLELFAPSTSHVVTVEVTATRAGMAGDVRLDAPAGWTVSPDRQPFVLKTAQERARVAFTITAPAQTGTASILAATEVNGIRYDQRRVDIHYDHIPDLLLLPPARLKAVCLDLAVRSRNIGYLPGPGDQVAESLARMGCTVTQIADTDLTPGKLRRFDAVVLGARALNTRPWLAQQMPALCSYADGGGTVVVQYNTTADLPSTPLGPYPLKVSRDRVTDETASVTFLAPEHPALNTPNRITAADFDGWVQERGLYFPNEWDKRYTALLSCHDPGEAPLTGGLLVAAYGRGWFVYTGLSFFRELPEGVPGAYRLFANLVSLGK